MAIVSRVVKTLIAVTLVAWLTFAFVGRTYLMTDDTGPVRAGERVAVEHITLRFAPPATGDVVMLADSRGHHIVPVVAGPGEAAQPPSPVDLVPEGWVLVGDADTLRLVRTDRVIGRPLAVVTPLDLVRLVS